MAPTLPISVIIIIVCYYQTPNEKISFFLTNKTNLKYNIVKPDCVPATNSDR